MLTIHETYGEFSTEEAENDPNYKGYIYATITAPLYWWRELEEHSPMIYFIRRRHDFIFKDFELSDFSYEQLDLTYPRKNFDCLIHTLNALRDSYCESQDTNYLRQIFKLLPLSYNETRIVQFDYSLLIELYSEHYDDDLFCEWDELCKWIRKTLNLSVAKEDLNRVKEFVREKL